MSRILLFTTLLSLIISSCGTLLVGVKKPIGILNKPDDLVIRNKKTGENIQLTNTVYGYDPIGQSTLVRYVGSGIVVKPYKGLELELTSNNVTKTIVLSRKHSIGLLIFEGIPTFGLFAIIDIATGGNKDHKPRFIDVKALFEDRPQPKFKKIKRHIRRDSEL